MESTRVLRIMDVNIIRHVILSFIFRVFFVNVNGCLESH